LHNAGYDGGREGKRGRGEERKREKKKKGKSHHSVYPIPHYFLF
jgi:hypothetical protein